MASIPTIAGSYITQLNKQNRISQKVSVGTLLASLQAGSATNITNDAWISASLVSQKAVAGASGAVTVAATQITASKIVVTTGLTSVVGFMATDTRSGSSTGSYINVSTGSVAGTIIGAPATSVSASVAIQAGDIFTWLAF